MEHSFNGFCCNCGAGLKYTVEVVYRNRTTGEIVKTEIWGQDCFETHFGAGAKFVRSGQFDVEAYEAAKLAAEAAQAASLAEFEARKAAFADRNAWLIEELKPFGMVANYDQWNGLQYTGQLQDNFAGSIIRSLQNGDLAVDLHDKAKRIICDIIAKSAGRSGSKKYNAKYAEIEGKLYV